jgi:predicted TIM-barrel fold metal-dependent hydrolase
MRRRRLAAAAVLAALALTGDLAAAPARPAPIIDMHLHAYAADENGPPPLGLCIPRIPSVPPLDPGKEEFRTIAPTPPCAHPIWSPKTDADVMEQTIAVLERRNIIGVLSGTPDRVRRWKAAAPRRIIAGVELNVARDELTPEALQKLFASGEFAVLGEVSNQYAGIAPDDPRMEPFWALAEKLDVPVAIHMGEGPVGASRMFPKYRARLSSPYLLEEVLARHPGLRVSVMHCGSPLADEMIAMLGTYPQLYVDLGGIQWVYPRAHFHAFLRKLVDAGFGKRVMFGSDQMVWPGVIEPAIAIVEEAPFLSAGQKRDIFYNNAARFLRLDGEALARHPKNP